MSLLAYKNYLAHHGIKGQKWGIRRYQNEDGSLTPEGREHYGLDKEIGQYKGNLKRRVKGLQKETIKVYKNLNSWNKSLSPLENDIAQDLFDKDVEKASKNKELKKDLLKIHNKYYGNPNDEYNYGNHDGAWAEKEKLYKKYPQHKSVLESFGFYEDFSSPNWFSNNMDPDHISDDYYKKAKNQTATVQAAAKAEWNDRLAKKYGQDAVNEILKKGYSSLV